MCATAIVLVRLSLGACPADPVAVFSLDAPSARFEADRSVLDVELAPDAPFSFDVLAAVALPFEPPEISCVQLSMSVAHDAGVLAIEEIVRESGLRDAGFFVLQKGSSESATGFIAATICDLSPVVRPFDGAMAVARARYALVAPHGSELIGRTLSTLIRFQDGLQGAGQPVKNLVFPSGTPVAPFTRDLEVRIHFRKDRSFLRGDANYDLKLDISDPVTTLHGLFLGDATILCDDAADADDSGGVDLSDAIFCFSYLFLGGDAPPPPFPGTGTDPTADALFCFDPPGATP